VVQKIFQTKKKKLIDFVNEANFEIRLHNYFPPPENHFVINIASLNQEIYSKSIEHCLKAINLSKKFGSKKYSVHAGFLVDPRPKDLKNRQVKKINELYNEEEAVLKMKSSLNIFEKEAGKDLKIYFENNVLNKKNLNKFCKNPFLLTDKGSYNKLKKNFNFNLLLDLAHLKVSCNTLGLNFYEEAEYLFDQTDYLHLSGNDDVEDRNSTISSDTKLKNFLTSKKLKNKTVTLEVYDKLENIIKDYHFLESLIN